MSRKCHRFRVSLALLCALATGCGPTRPVYFFQRGDMAYYKGVATEIEYPDVEANRLAEVEGAMPPLTVRNSDTHEIWELTLEEAVQNALNNSKVMRTLGGQVQATPSRLLTGPQGVTTVYDPAIAESNPRTGVEGALSAFDAQFNTSMFWERNERPVHLAGFFTGFLAPTLQQDLGTFQSEIRKTAATGGTFFVRNNTRYEYNNNPSNLFPSSWNTNFEAEFRHPLLQGAGVQFNRIAGPNATPGSFTFGFGNGVILARINTDVALAQFESGVRNLVNDVETAYWELYYAYRNLDAVIAGRDSALQTWRRVYALFEEGSEGGKAADEAQAREQFYLFSDQIHRAQNNLYQVESRLRYIMGLAASDGRLIRPSDEPTTAKVNFDWFAIHNEALARSVELRQQKWQTKRREMELIAARNFLLPRLDAVGRYRWLGFGDDFWDANRVQNAPFDNALQNLTGGDFQEWQLGGQLSIPIGFRQSLAGVRNAQLNLARERAVLQDQELELSHQLSDAIRNLEGAYTSAQDNFNRRISAKRLVESVKAAYDVGTVTLDLLLDAQRRLADAESQYFRAVINYNLAIAEVHYRKGSLLEYNGVFLAEGPWPGKAYFDAEKRAEGRSASTPFNYGFSRPNVFSRGQFEQLQYRTAGEPGMPAPVRGAPQAVPGETTPAPKPAPMLESLPEPAAGASNSPSRLGPNVTAPFAWGNLGIARAAATAPAPKGAAIATTAVGWQASPTAGGTVPTAARTVPTAAHTVPTAAHTVSYAPTRSTTDEVRADHAAGAAHQPVAEWKRAQR